MLKGTQNIQTILFIKLLTSYIFSEDEKMTNLKKEEKIKLRYRVIIHLGDHEEAEIVREFENYKSK